MIFLYFVMCCISIHDRILSSSLLFRLRTELLCSGQCIESAVFTGGASPSILRFLIYLVNFHSSSFLYLLSTKWYNCRSLIFHSTFTISWSWIFEYSTRVPLLVTRPREANLKTSIQIRYRLLLSDGDHVSGSKCDNSF